MANTKFSTSSINQGLVKSRSMLVGNTFYDPTEFESIATVVVGAGGSSTVTFSSIPQGYASLQIRGIVRTNRTGQNFDTVAMRYNNDSGNNYMEYHELFANGSTAAPFAGNASTNRMLFDYFAGNNANANVFGVFVLDILDYSNTNKYKTFRNFAGIDNNGSGAVALGSGLWMSTSAITQIELYGPNGNFIQYSKFALYGIRD